jgi:hypothetical protein
MTFPFTVKSGDNLSAIAKRFGLRSFRDIYDHPDNAAFRIKRPNPNLIFPGDVVMIPGAGPPGPPGVQVLGSEVRYCGNDPKRLLEAQASRGAGPRLAFAIGFGASSFYLRIGRRCVSKGDGAPQGG